MPHPRFAKAGALALLAVAVAGCQMAAPMRAPIAPQRAGFEGTWLSTDNVAVSTLSGGQFVTKARDTGATLATGSYRNIDQRTVTINVTSMIRNTTSNVNCALVNASQMNCTSSTGSQFTLVRAPGTA